MKTLRTPIAPIAAGAIVALGAAPAQAAGLPQLDISTFPTQLFWLTVSFGLLYGLMSRVTLPRVDRLISERDATVASNLEEAERLRREAKIMAAQCEQRIAKARHQAEAMAEATHVDGEERIRVALAAAAARNTAAGRASSANDRTAALSLSATR